VTPRYSASTEIYASLLARRVTSRFAVYSEQNGGQSSMSRLFSCAKLSISWHWSLNKFRAINASGLHFADLYLWILSSDPRFRAFLSSIITWNKVRDEITHASFIIVSVWSRDCERVLCNVVQADPRIANPTGSARREFIFVEETDELSAFPTRTASPARSTRRTRGSTTFLSYFPQKMVK